MSKRRTAVHTLHSTISGHVNNDPFTMTGKLLVASEPGEVALSGKFSKIPKDFHPWASSAASWL